jgi:hypothetical protein
MPCDRLGCQQRSKFHELYLRLQVETTQTDAYRVYNYAEVLFW